MVRCALALSATAQQSASPSSPPPGLFCDAFPAQWFVKNLAAPLCNAVSIAARSRHPPALLHTQEFPISAHISHFLSVQIEAVDSGRKELAAGPAPTAAIPPT